MNPKTANLVVDLARRRVTAHADVPDGDLLARFASARDEAAFAELARRHGAMVLAACRRILRDAHLAEDACQAAFLVLARRAAQVRRPDRLAGWLYGVALRTARNARANAALRPAAGLDGAGGIAVSDPTPELVWRELGPVLDAEVGRLPEKYRSAFVLCYLEGKSLTEAASLLGCPKGTVGSRLNWARPRLAERLTKRGIVATSAAIAAALSQGATVAALPAGFATTLARAAAEFARGAVPGAGGAAALAEAVLEELARGGWRPVLALALAAGLMVGRGSPAAVHSFRPIRDATNRLFRQFPNSRPR